MISVKTYYGSVDGGTVVDFDNMRSPANTCSGRLSSNVDPVGAALAVRSIRIAIDSMQAQFFQNSFFDSLA